MTLGQAPPLSGPQFLHLCSTSHLVRSPCVTLMPQKNAWGAISCCPNPDGHTPLPQIIAFDELRTDFKNPIDQGNPARAVSDTCVVPRCVRPSVLPYVAGGGRRGDRKTEVEGTVAVPLPLPCPSPQQTPGSGSGLGFLLAGQPLPGSGPLPWRRG